MTLLYFSITVDEVGGTEGHAGFLVSTVARKPLDRKLLNPSKLPTSSNPNMRSTYIYIYICAHPTPTESLYSPCIPITEPLCSPPQEKGQSYM